MPRNIKSGKPFWGQYIHHYIVWTAWNQVYLYCTFKYFNCQHLSSSCHLYVHHKLQLSLSIVLNVGDDYINWLDRGNLAGGSEAGREKLRKCWKDGVREGDKEIRHFSPLYKFCTTPVVYTRVKPPSHVEGCLNQNIL